MILFPLNMIGRIFFFSSLYIPVYVLAPSSAALFFFGCCWRLLHGMGVCVFGFSGQEDQRTGESLRQAKCMYP